MATRKKNIVGILATALLLLLVIFGSLYLKNKSLSTRSVDDLYDGLADDPAHVNNRELQLAEARVKQILIDLEREGREGNQRFVLSEDELKYRFFYPGITTDEQAALCGVIFNQDHPNTTVAYHDEEAQFSVEVPYNEAWGNRLFRITPYDSQTGEPRFEFGPPGSLFEGNCGWQRVYMFSWQPSTVTVQELVGELSEGELPELTPVPPTVVATQPLPIIKYMASGFCDVPSVIILGPRYQFVISRSCGSEKDLEVMEAMARSLKVLPESGR